jgi:hypothetical protein
LNPSRLGVVPAEKCRLDPICANWLTAAAAWTQNDDPAGTEMLADDDVAAEADDAAEAPAEDDMLVADDDELPQALSAMLPAAIRTAPVT